MADTSINSMGLREQKERKWEEVQIKAFKVWVNTYLEPLGYVIEDVSEDFKSGVNLCTFLEQVSKKKLARWSKKPAMRVHKIENLNIALQYIQKDLKVKLVGIGPEDIADGQMKLTLGMLWSLFKKLRIEIISEEGQSSEMGLLAWLKKMAGDYEGVEIKNFKESFNDGLAFCALINAMDPEALDYYELDQSATEKNIATAFDIAESKLGIPKLLDAEDLLAGTVDERAVILYSSMFFHAYVADEEKRKLVEQKKSIGEQIKELRENLERERAEKERLLKEQERLLAKSQREASDKDALIARLRAKIRQLKEEIEFLKKKGLADSELRSILESKLKMLQDLIDTTEAIEASMVDISNEDLLAWIKKMTENYENVNVENFTDSFSDGMVMSALVHAMNPDAIDFNSLNPENKKENIDNALNIAQEKLGIPAILNSTDVSEGNASESELVAYSTFFLKKYIAENGSMTVPPEQKKSYDSDNNMASKALLVGSKKFTKADLLDWAKKMTQDYDNVNIEDFKNSFSDGMAFSAIINSLEPEALDFKSLNPENAEENLNNALKIAENKFGIPISVSAADILSKTADENEIAAYTGQFYQKYIAESELFGNPNIGKIGATPNPLAGAFPSKLGLSGSKFTPEDLLDWIKSSTAGYPNVNIESFKDSFNDGMALAALIHSMDPSAIDFDLLTPENAKDNVTKVLNVAEKKFNIPKLLNGDKLVAGEADEKDIIAYNAQFFQKYLEESGLFDAARSSGVHGNKTSENDLLNWVQKITKDYPDVEVVNFKDSFNDGLAFSAIVNSISPDDLDFNALDKSNTKENIENVFNIAEQKLGVPQFINPDDLMNGNVDERDIIAYNAKLFSKYLDEVVLNNDSKYAPADLLNWVKKMTEGYDNVNVENFKDSLSDGMALSALIHSMDPSALDFNSLNPENKKANLFDALSIAERRFNIPKFADANALLAGDVEEADVIEYLSKYLDTFINEAGKYGIAGSKTRSHDPYSPENDLLEWARKITADYDNVDIVSFENSFSDGVAFSAIVEALKPGSIDVSSLDPSEAKHNLLAAFDIAKNDLGVAKLLDPDTLIDGDCDERDIMAYTSSLFQKYLDTIDTQKTPFTKEDLLSWAQKTTSDYDNVQVNDFTDSFKDGLALAALVHAIDPSALDFNTLNSENAKENIETALNAANKKFGIPKSIDSDSVMNGSADIAGYTGQLFKKYIAEAGKFGKFTNIDSLSSGDITGDKEKQKLLDELEERKQKLLAEIDALQKGIQDEIALRKKMAEEIDFLKQQANSDAELRSVLEQKVSVLEALVEGRNATLSELSEQQHKLSMELDEQKKRGEELNSGLSELETEKSQLLTDAEEKGRKLRELEERRRRLLQELEDLRKRVEEEMKRRQEQAAEIAALKEVINNMTQKQIVQSKARIGLDTLKKNLEDHIEDLYRWRDLNEDDLEDEVEEFDLSKVITDMKDKNFEDQLEYLDGKLQEENKTLSRIIKLKDDKEYLDDVVIKAGWLVMKGHKEWKRRWFKLAGNKFSFYEDDTSEDVAGSILLDEGCDVVRHKAIKEDENSNKKVWPLKVTVGNRKLFVRAATKKERHAWFAALSSKIAHLNYSKSCEEKSERPDTRLVGALNANTAPVLDVSNRPITDAVIAAIVKGMPGRDELEHINLQNTNLSNDNLSKICDVLEKLSNVKSFNVSNNKLDSACSERFTSALRPVLTNLDVSNNSLDDSFLIALSNVLPTFTSLNSLNLNNCLFTVEGINKFVEVYSNSEIVVQDLCLNNNKLGNDGVVSLSSLFEKKTFKRVLLSGNAIGDEGVIALANALSNSNVEELDLSNNSITSKGALALKQLMESNDNLHTLNLSSNEVVSGDDSATLLAPSGLKISSLKFTRN